MGYKSHSLLYLLIAGFLAALTFVLIKVAGEGVPPIALSSVRAALAALVLYIISSLQERRYAPPR